MSWDVIDLRPRPIRIEVNGELLKSSYVSPYPTFSEPIKAKHMNKTKKEQAQETAQKEAIDILHGEIALAKTRAINTLVGRYTNGKIDYLTLAYGLLEIADFYPTLPRSVQ